jgi:hypothetical protein
MRRLLASSLLAAAAGAAALVLAASSASASTWTIAGSPADGKITATSTDTKLVVQDSSGPQTLTCALSTSAVTAPNGTVAGPKVGDVTDLTFTNCTLAGFIPFTVATSGFNYALNALSQNGDAVTGSVTGAIHADISSSVGCSATVTGSTVAAIYHNDLFQLEIPGTGQDLTLSNVNVAGCQNLLHEGDSASFSGHYDADNPVTITENP